MALYPEVQRKAQVELDSVVEAGRLPNYSDRPKLPYIDALIKEIHRWNPVLPLGMDIYSKLPGTLNVRRDQLYHIA